MRDAKEVAQEIFDEIGGDEMSLERLTHIVRAREAGARVEALAGFAEERAEVRGCGCRVRVGFMGSCCLNCQPAVYEEHRLVGPWTEAGESDG